MKYYRNLIPKNNHSWPTFSKKSTGGGDGFTAELQSAIAKELDNNAVVEFTQKNDSDYEESLSKLVGWSEMSSPLIPDKQVSLYYSQFQSLFLLTHMVLRWSYPLMRSLINAAVLLRPTILLCQETRTHLRLWILCIHIFDSLCPKWVQ